MKAIAFATQRTSRELKQQSLIAERDFELELFLETAFTKLKVKHDCFVNLCVSAHASRRSCVTIVFDKSSSRPAQRHFLALLASVIEVAANINLANFSVVIAKWDEDETFLFDYLSPQQR